MTPVPAKLRLERLDARCVWSAGVATATTFTTAVTAESSVAVTDPVAEDLTKGAIADFSFGTPTASVPPAAYSPSVTGSAGGRSALYRLIPDGPVSGPVFRPTTDFYFDPNAGPPDQPAPVAAVLAEVRAAVLADWAAPVPVESTEPTDPPAAPNPEPSDDIAPGAAAVEQPEEEDEPERRPDATVRPTEAFDTGRKPTPAPTVPVNERTTTRRPESDESHQAVSWRDAAYEDDDNEADTVTPPAAHSGNQAEYEAAGEQASHVPPKTDDELVEGDWVPAVRWAVLAAAGGLTARRLHGAVATRVRRSPDPFPQTASYQQPDEL